jgi:hypothetical protein
VLRPPGMQLLHEKPINITEPSRASARYLSLSLPFPPFSFLYSHSHPYRITVVLSTTLLLAQLGAVLSRTSPGPRQT